MSAANLGLRLRSVTRIRNILAALLADAIFLRCMWVAKTAAEEARHSIAEKTYLTAVLDALSILEWRRDSELTLVDCNTAYSDLLERTRDDVLGNHLELGAHSIEMEGPSSMAASTQASG